jgi:hypothetical protein
MLPKFSYGWEIILSLFRAGVDSRLLGYSLKMFLDLD